MKKLIIAALIASLIAGAAFAQVAEGISIGGWGRGNFAPLIIQGAPQKDGETVKDTDGNAEKAKVFAGTGSFASDNDIDVEIEIAGKTDFVGFGLGLAWGGLSATPAGFTATGAHIWAKPLGNDMITVYAGNFVVDTLRGKIGSINDGFEYFTLRKANNKAGGLFTWEKDQIFTRLGKNVGLGFGLTSSPVDGLFLGLAVDGPGLWFDENGLFAESTATQDFTAKHAYRSIQVSAGYELDGIGLARVQYVGGYAGSLKHDQSKLNESDLWNPPSGGYKDFVDHVLGNNARIEAAFAYTGTEDVVVDLGFRAYLPGEVEFTGNPDKFKFNNGIGISLGAKCSFGDFGLATRIDTTMAGTYSNETDYKKNDELPFVLGFRLVPTYNVFDATTIGLDLGLGISGKSKVAGEEQKDDAVYFGFGAFAKQDLGGAGHIKAGLTYTLRPSLNSDDGGLGKTTTTYDYFSIPVVLEFSF